MKTTLPIKLRYPTEDEVEVSREYRRFLYTALSFQIQNFIDGRLAVALDAFRRGDIQAIERLAATPYPRPAARAPWDPPREA